MKKTFAILFVLILLGMASSGWATGETATTITLITRTGDTLSTYTADTSGGNLVTNTGNVKILFWNTSQSEATTITFVTPQTIYGLPVQDLEIALPPRAFKVAGPFPPETFNYTSGTNSGKMLILFTGDGNAHTVLAPFK